MQQSYARRSSVLEPVSLTELAEDAIRINAESLMRHRVQVTREYEEVPLLTTDRHEVLQVLVNLLGNAKYALEECAQKRLVVRISRSGTHAVRVAVIDNGMGIPQENLTQIFNHGFTTRKDGHGFGLHSGALVAQGLGGKLSAHSDGAGLGAEFILELPIHHQRA
jgi:signal transduction histidine kinase